MFIKSVYVSILLVFGLDTVNQIQQNSTAHMLQINVQQWIVKAFREVCDSLANVLIRKLLSNIVNIIGDNTAGACSQGFGGRITCATESGFVEKLTYVR